jgi:hypothetical protein
MNSFDRDPNQKLRPRWHTVSQCTPDSNVADAVVLTLDIDWACDEVLADCIELVEESGAPATWFVTHDTPLLERLRASENFELGIHPNFNPLLDGNGASAERIIDEILAIVPEAVSIRSHSMVQSSRLLDLFLRKGLRFDCNHFIPEQSGILLKPWRLWNGMVKVPHFWEDDAACIYDAGAAVRDLVGRDGLKVFDFHPIHVFLNTEDLNRYDQTRSLHSIATELVRYRFSGVGARTHLLDLLAEFKNAR